MVIEDAHWADRSTRDLLAFLIRNQQALDGLLIVVVYRSDELHRSHPLRPLLAELDRVGWVTRMELGRLSRQDTGELVARLIGREPGEDVLDTVFRRTEGNPLFVEALVGEGELGAGLPESLRDLLMAGVRRLPDDTQELLRVASAAGERVGYALLAAVTGQDNAGLAQALRPAVAANVLLIDADGFVFRHALIREAIHDELLPGEGGQLHSRFAETISADPSLVPPGRAATEAAHHWYAAHDMTWALISAWQAAAESGHALAHAEQLAMLSRVLELWEQVPGAEQHIGTSQLEVLETATRVADFAGEFDRGITFAKAALRQIDPAAEPVRAALMLEARGHLKYQLGREDYADDLREAARLVPADPPTPARARVLEALAHDIHHRPGGWDEAEFQAQAEEAVAVARQAGDPATEAAALVTLACAQPLERGHDPAQGAAGRGPRRRHPGQRLPATAAGGHYRVRHARGHGPARAGRRGGAGRDHGRPGVRAGPDLGRGPGHQPGRAAGLAGPVGRGRRGHRASAPAPPAAAEPVLTVAAVRRHGPGPRRCGRDGRIRGPDQGRTRPHPV